MLFRSTDRTPVLIGVGLIDQREDDPLVAREPLELMVSAAQAAGHDCGAPDMLCEIDHVYVPQGRWRYRDPGRAIAERVGSTGVHSVVAKVGVLQEQLIGRACERILAGDVDVVLVVGGEAGFRLLRGRITGQEVTDNDQDTEADEVWRAADLLMTEAERSGGLGGDAPAYYAVLDSALRSRRKTDLAEHRTDIAEMYSGFSRVAADNPHAWRHTPTDASTIRDATAKTRCSRSRTPSCTPAIGAWTRPRRCCSAPPRRRVSSVYPPRSGSTRWQPPPPTT